MKKLAVFSLLVIASILSFQAGAVDFDFVESAISEWFDPEKAPIVGLEVELTGLGQEQISNILHEFLGGTVQIKKKSHRMLDEQGRPKQWDIQIFKHKQTKIGSFRVELDDNGTGLEDFDKHKVVVELVTTPLQPAAVEEFSKALIHLQQKGARGVDSGEPLSIQLNLQVGDGTRESVSMDGLLAFLRNYFSPTHREILEQYYHVPANRRDYIGEYTPGMMKRILDPDYKPTKRQLFDDFMYRQSLELFGYENAWTMELELVKALVQTRVEKQGLEVLLPIMKWNNLRLSSLMMFLFPDDWISQYLDSTWWFKALPIMEVREPSSDFRLREYYRTIVGLFIKSMNEGEFVFLEKVGGLLKRDFAELKKAEVDAGDQPWIVRTMLYDGKTDPYDPKVSREEVYFKRIYGVRNSTLVFVNGQEIPETPLILGGESVVFHNIPSLGKIFRGKYNPGLSNQFIGEFIEHKYHEALFWSQYAPGAMAKTKTLAEFVSASTSGADLQKSLDETFPEGWVIKGAFESATQEQFIITDRHNIEEQLSLYSESFEDFQALREKAIAEAAGNNPDLQARMTREHPAFFGWRLKRYMKFPENAIVQSRLDIKSEYRVEAIGGQVIGGDSTIPRYQYDIPASEDWRDAEEIKKVEAFVRQTLEKLPLKLRATPFAFDIAVLQDGSLRLIESNPLSNSGFLAFDKRGVKALNKFLIRFPEMLEKGEVSEGYTPVEQKLFIETFNWRHGLNLSLDVPQDHFQQMCPFLMRSAQ